MAEENKSPEVEIDTDGVNEEVINVDAPKVDNTAFEKKQDVDLGYTDVSEEKRTYDKEKDLGRAYNEMMNLVQDEDWVVFLDHDAMFVHRDWYKYLREVIKNNPNFGFFTATTNRIGCPWQLIQGVDRNNHDMFYHKQIAKELMDRDLDVVDVTNERVFLSGVVMIVQKKTWKKSSNT